MAERNHEFNGYFEFDAWRFYVFVIKLSYSWKLAKKSSSQARQRQTVYPFRAEQSDINVTLQFPSPGIVKQDFDSFGDLEGEEPYSYRNFGDFARAYHLAVTSSAGRIGDAVPQLLFCCNDVPMQTNGNDGKSYDGPINYYVALPSINMVFSNDSIAPTLNLTLKVLQNEINIAGSASSSSGSMSEMLAAYKVTSGAKDSDYVPKTG